jgi:phospholipid N-methyltransferase
MTSRLASFGAIVLCTSLASHAVAYDDIAPAEIADLFVAALQHHRFKDAAARFAPEATRDTSATALALKRIDDSVGGFSTMHPVATLPNGRTIKLEVPARKNVPFDVRKFVQVRYASTAGDGTPVFYEVDLTTDSKPQVLSLGLHFPAADAQSTKRANRLVSAINR